MLTQIKFGTDGWRAVMDREYTFANVERVAQGFAEWLHESYAVQGKTSKPRIVIGYDFRDRSDAFAEAFARVLLGNNIEVALSDRPVPTPAVSRYVTDHGYDAGIGITASHNPGNYNGIKIKDRDGSSADPSITRRVEELIDKAPIHKDARESIDSIRKDILTGFLAGIRSYVRTDLFKNKAFNILVDSMHGVGENHVEKFLAGTPIKVTTVRGERDIHFGGNAPEPILKNLSMSSELMKSGKFDLCAVTDGDADRIGALRPGGDFVSPGTILSMLMLHLAQDLGKKGSVVTTVSNTALIYRVARKLGLKTHETPVGFKYICEIMRKEEVLIAGEESGGLAFHKYMLERDGILSALLMIQMMEFRKQSFEEILVSMEKEFGKFYYVRNDMKYPDEKKPKLIEALKKLNPDSMEGCKLLQKNTADGFKFSLEGDTWLLFRLSGTEPLLRVYSESTDLAKAKALVAWGTDLANGM